MSSIKELFEQSNSKSKDEKWVNPRTEEKEQPERFQEPPNNIHAGACMSQNKPILEEEHFAQGRVHSLPVSCIFPNPNQPRRVFAEESIIKLADSIRQFGLIQPITVRRVQEGYEIVSGERRLRAIKELNMDKIPAIIIETSEVESAEMAIIENIMREDLNIFEQAEAIQSLIDTYGLTQEQIAIRLSNSQSYIANKLRLLRLTLEERRKIIENRLSERHARALLRISDRALRAKLLERIISDGMNVSRTESMIEELVSKTASNKPKAQAYYKDLDSFYSAINRALDTVKRSNLNIKTRKIEGDSYTELTILIPKAPKEDTIED